MSLDKLRKDIYNTDHSSIGAKTHDADYYDPTHAEADSSPFVSEHEWQDRAEAMRRRRRLIWKIAGAVVASAAIIAGSWYAYGVWKKNSFLEDRVSISIDGPQDADSTQTVQYKISYVNNNRVTLKDAEVYLEYAENFQPVDNVNFKYLSPGSSKIYIGDIKPGSSGSFEMKGVFYAPKDFQVYVRATLKYGVSSRQEKLEAKTQFGVNITTTPIVLDVVLPREAVSGDSVECVIDYKNLDIRAVNEGRVKVEYPEGFQFVSAEPAPSEGNSAWYVGTLEQNQGGRIRIQGKLAGDSQQVRTFKIMLGKQGEDSRFVVYNQRSLQTKMIAAAFSISQEVTSGAEDKIVKPGRKLSYLVKFKNTSGSGLRNSILNVELSGKVLDFSQLIIGKGAFDESKGIITWKASDLPQLAALEPGASGEARFSIVVKEMIPVENENDRNYIVRSVAKIDSPDVATAIGSNKVVSSDILDLKVSSKVIFETLGFYKDANIANSGPIPPVVGKETTYTLHWAVSSVSNDLNDATVTAALPSGIRWTGKTYPEGEQVSYDSRTNVVVWKPGVIQAGAGIIKPKKEVSFQIGVTPQANQIDRELTLLNSSVFTAKDAFTGQTISLDNGIKNSNLREDASISGTDYKVSK